MRAMLMLLDFALEFVPASVAFAVRRRFFPAWWIDDLKGASAGWVLQGRPDYRETMRRMNDAATRAPLVNGAHCNGGSRSSVQLQWGLLLPITSRGSDDIWSRLELTLGQLVDSVP